MRFGTLGEGRETDGVTKRTDRKPDDILDEHPAARVWSGSGFTQQIGTRLLEGAEHNLLQFRQWASHVLRRDRGASQDRKLGLQRGRIGSLADRLFHGSKRFIRCWFSLVEGAEILLDETP